jgi:hypothetical protein
MSLLRLLTAGRSLVSVRDMESRYRLTTQRLLPQFVPARNPFSSKQETESVPVVASHQGAEIGTAPLKAGTWGFARALWLRTAVLWSGWKVKLNRLVARPRQAAAKPAIPQFSRLPVQGELSLDRVKVMRNDLSEADWEVVPAKSKAAPALLVAEPTGGAESAWKWVMPRVFHVGKR